MKYFNLVVYVIITCIVTTVNGQNFYAGIKGGLNYSDFKITGDGIEQEVSPELLFGVGGVFGVHFNRIFSVQLEPMCVMKGGILKQDAPSPDFETRASFIEAPLLFKFSPGRKVKPFLVAGVSLAYLLSSKVEGEIQGVVFEANWRDVSKQFGWNVLAGCGIQIPLGKGSIFFEARYVHGLTNFNKGGTVEFEADGFVLSEEVDSDDELFSKELRAMMGYMISIGG